ncbi:MAG: UDP-2,4-diacetamido-2,4,6-trideoxy-beta-L-altropyranose hydrolase [Nitrospirae bacterium]|nr:UDP-2,4-diacetamido-2,4,6-trideoxy-beta-L-altropyranose hydrolase [Nitrospirota bacterium]
MDDKEDLQGKTLVLRADSFTGVGTGHLMRAMALGEAWKERGGEVVVVTYCEPLALVSRLKDAGFEVHCLHQPYPSRECGKILAEVSSLTSSPANTPWLLLDGLHFDQSYHQYLKGYGYRLAVIDDMAKLSFYDCDLVLNQNLHAFDLHYKTSSGTKLLLGPEFVLLRREFRNFSRRIGQSIGAVPDRAQKVLITLGGIDLKNNTEKILLALKELGGLDVTVIAGVGNPYLKHLDNLRMASPKKVVYNVSDMANLMSQTDVAISSGGTTVWELAFMGVPSIVGRVAPIEDYLVNGLKKHGLFVDSGWFDGISKGELADKFVALAEDRPLRQEMAVKARATITGEGCSKVIDAMNDNHGVLP